MSFLSYLFWACFGICNADDHPEQNVNLSLQKLQFAFVRQFVDSCESLLALKKDVYVLRQFIFGELHDLVHFMKWTEF